MYFGARFILISLQGIHWHIWFVEIELDLYHVLVIADAVLADELETLP